MHKKKTDLRQIIDGCVNKNLSSEQILYKAFYGYVSSVAFRYLKDKELAKEVINDAFVKVFNKIDTFYYTDNEAELPKLFKGWIGKITANLSIDKIRAKKPLIYAEDIPEEARLEMSVQPSDRLSYNEIIALLNELPPIQQVIFNMYAIEGFSHEEIAKELNMLPNTSRVYLKRARERLITLYQAG
ncbi:MAG: sigma-70 family RNA polymerase sigma factor [Pedobacter sp.]|nr:MAG: sigma-70 family RNA polymerase sigma factor [Pedobacter sp.]